MKTWKAILIALVIAAGVSWWAIQSGQQPTAADTDQARRELWEKLQAHKVWIGMTQTQARESWGEPQRVNRTTRANGVTEQWVYDRRYLYFQDGKLVTIQE
jgi:hypothetical protein